MPIDPLPLVPPLGTKPVGGLKLDDAGQSGGASSAAQAFGKFLQDAVNNLQQVQSASDQATIQLAEGKPVDLHDVMIKTEQANLTFQLALQVRNKLLDSYQEVMRMSV